MTIDGAARIHIGGPLEDSGKSEDSIQFIGSFDEAGGDASGSGVIVGQGCAAPTAGRFCGNAVTAEVTLTADSSIDAIIVTTTDDQEVWTFSTEWSDTSYDWWTNGAPGVEYLDGLLQATFAEFVDGNDTIISISGGRLFFQSPGSGCVGNGVLTTHFDGHYAVYDVALTVENCSATHAHLNGEFEGLATEYVLSPWDYWTTGFVMWLSTPQGGEPPVAMMVRGDWIYYE